ncbi:MAG: hypothetical protein GWN16_09635 [Calditrichae bacterium]|nr:hypothetical protein [Calditrichia bacterium]
MRSIFHRSLLISILTLLIGFGINQFYSGGIRWGLLKPEFGNHPNPASITYVDADSAFTLLMSGQADFVDVRPTEEYNIDHIPGAISMPLLNFYTSAAMLATLNKQHTYIVYCFEAKCPDAEKLASELANRGFSNIMIMYDGLSGWLERGYPMER